MHWWTPQSIFVREPKVSQKRRFLKEGKRMKFLKSITMKVSFAGRVLNRVEAWKLRRGERIITAIMIWIVNQQILKTWLAWKKEDSLSLH